VLRSRNPLHLSTFSMDEYEGALRHRYVEPPCQLLAEIHSTLVYLLRTVNFHRHSAVESLMALQEALEEQGQEESEEYGVSTSDLLAAMADVGNNWERAPLRHNEDRAGWEESLVGCLKDVNLHPAAPCSFTDNSIHSTQPSRTFPIFAAC
jgi:bromodomain adjacent to zinc finger domain protein 1A